MASKARIPKVVRKAAQTGAPVPANINLSIETLQLSHEALVQIRKPTSQVTLAVARAMNELETLIAMFGAQQQAQQAQAIVEPVLTEDKGQTEASSPVAPAAAKRKG